MLVSQTARFILSRSVGLLRTRIAAPLFYGYIIVSILVYIALASHTPLTLYPGAMHDDGLFIKLGRSLAEGNWLGPFDQFTLMKGPGYSAFLAIASWTGFPVTLAHALFHCFSIAVFAAAFHRFMKSSILSGLMFTLLLWHPISLSVYLLRVLREEIYYSQTLLIIAAFVTTLFVPAAMSRRILFAVLGGLTLGWFWLTREEGFWILPGIAVIGAAGLLNAFRMRLIGAAITSLAIILCIFATTQIGFRLANYRAYGSFVGVDFKETNFQRALRAIDSVRSGGTKPFIPVTKATRARIYAVSPSFASTKNYFDGARPTGWVAISCQFYPDSCGEIAAGWFMWGLRDAASQLGHYSSPAAASAFFKQMADEITGACGRGELECKPQLIAEMPPTTWRELAERLPSHYKTAFDLLLMEHPPLQFNLSNGTDETLWPALKFLNRPLISRSLDLLSSATKYTLSAWFYKSGHDWMEARVRQADGSSAEAKMVRTPSPDIQTGFHDPDASQQRFTLETNCNDTCFLQIETPDGQKGEKTLGDIRNGSSEIKLGDATMHVDSTLASDPFKPTKIEDLCNRLRMTIMVHYYELFLPVLIAGILSFLAATLLYWREITKSACYIFAFACWLLVLVRVSLITMIDTTSFHAITGNYMAPAYFLLVSAAVLSCAALLNLADADGGFQKS